MVVQAVKSQCPGGRGRQISAFQASLNLVYRSSSETAKATQRNPVSENQPNKNPLKANGIAKQLRTYILLIGDRVWVPATLSN